mmetsp:Transcript_71584/g.190946  ORF Transcript_71584/g.190946 Transcript_71584/m.190946 type:complete len:203 (-) Transcript_71584:965-1573(-)
MSEVGQAVLGQLLLQEQHLGLKHLEHRRLGLLLFFRGRRRRRRRRLRRGGPLRRRRGDLFFDDDLLFHDCRPLRAGKSHPPQRCPLVQEPSRERSHQHSSAARLRSELHGVGRGRGGGLRFQLVDLLAQSDPGELLPVEARVQGRELPLQLLALCPCSSQVRLRLVQLGPQARHLRFELAGVGQLLSELMLHEVLLVGRICG